MWYNPFKVLSKGGITGITGVDVNDVKKSKNLPKICMILTKLPYHTLTIGEISKK